MNHLLRFFFGIVFFINSNSAFAESISIDLGQGSATAKLIQLVVLMTVLALAPSILIMVTSFTRIVVVLSFLRNAIGLQQSPPNPVLISLALFLTFFVMSPAIETAYKDGLSPYMEQKINEEQAFEKVSSPFKKFMLKQVREEDLRLFANFEGSEKYKTQDDVPLRVLTPAFMISELKRAFEIGFLLFIPFLIIDMVVASVLMSMGMMMLPPIIISLPFKIIFFVLIDGWHLIAGSLVKSFG